MTFREILQLLTPRQINLMIYAVTVNRRERRYHQRSVLKTVSIFVCVCAQMFAHLNLENVGKVINQTHPTLDTDDSVGIYLCPLYTLHTSVK